MNSSKQQAATCANYVLIVVAESCFESESEGSHGTRCAAALRNERENNYPTSRLANCGRWRAATPD